MASLGDLVVNLKANSKNFDSNLKKAQGSVSNFAQGVLALATGAAGMGMLKLAADAETLAVQFKVLLGSASGAKQMIADIDKFAATTPFAKMDIAAAGQTLLAFKFSAEEVLPTLQNMGNIGAATGAQIGDLATILGRAMATGKVQGDLLNQLIERRVPILDELANVTGFASSEILKMASAGKISGEHLKQAFENMGSGSGKFATGMAELAGTSAGKFSTLKDNIQAFATVMGAHLLPVANMVMDVTLKMVNHFSGMGPTMIEAAAAIVAVSLAFKALAVAQMAVAQASVIKDALSGPKGWVKLAIGATIAAAAVLGMRYAMSGLGEEAAESAQSLADAKAAVDALSTGGGTSTSADSPKFSEGANSALLSAKRDLAVLRGELTEINRQGMDFRDSGATHEQVNEMTKLQIEKQKILDRQEAIKTAEKETAEIAKKAAKAAEERQQIAERHRKTITDTKRDLKVQLGMMTEIDAQVAEQKEAGMGTKQMKLFRGMLEGQENLEGIKGQIGQPVKGGVLAEHGSEKALKIILGAGKDQKLLKEAAKQTAALKTLVKQGHKTPDSSPTVQGAVA
jgi:tape measure domain-containing protein